MDKFEKRRCIVQELREKFGDEKRPSLYRSDGEKCQGILTGDEHEIGATIRCCDETTERLLPKCGQEALRQMLNELTPENAGRMRPSPLRDMTQDPRHQGVVQALQRQSDTLQRE